MRKTVIRSILTIISIAALSSVSFAQDESSAIESRGFSLGMQFGLSDLWGDVGTKNVIDHYTNNKYTDLLHYMGGLMLRYTFHPAISARLNLNYGTIFATDEWNLQKAKKANTLQDDYVQRYARGLDIKDNIFETSLTFEFSPMRLGSYNSRAAKANGQVYLLAGIGYFHFQPYSHYTDPVTKVTSWQKIYDLHLEGDGFTNMPGAPAAYSLWQIEIPLGIGYRRDIGEHFNVGVQWEWRMTTFDYLDGVSNKYIDPKYFDLNLSPDKAYIAKAMYDRTWIPNIDKGGMPVGAMRGNPGNNDSYSTISIVMYWKFNGRGSNWWQ